jgi:addiction module RelB/DinJ family antitoxin
MGYNTIKERDIMANTSAVYARIDSGLKENAEQILSQLGISPSGAIQMLYSQIVLTRGIPFEIKLPDAKPKAIGGMSREELDTEIAKGIKSIKSGETYTQEELDAELSRNFGI